MLGLGLGLGLACQGLVNNVLPLKLSSCMSHDFDCVNKVQVVDCVLCDLDLEQNVTTATFVLGSGLEGEDQVLVNITITGNLLVS